MKVKRSEAVALFKSMGFPNASTWDDDKLVARLREVPSKLKEDEVEKGHQQLYNGLTQLGKDDVIELTGGEGKGKGDKAEAAEAPAEEGKGKKPEAKGKKEKSEKPGKGKKSKDTEGKSKKRQRKARPEVERDGFGAAKGTIRANVNAALTGELQDEAAIMKAAGVTKKQARIRLRRARRHGFVEVVKTIQYRLTEKGLKQQKAKKEKAE